MYMFTFVYVYMRICVCMCVYRHDAVYKPTARKQHHATQVVVSGQGVRVRC